MTWWQLLFLPWKLTQQRIDLQILWPSLREQEPNIDIARQAFRAHMEMDTAYDYMSQEQRDDYIHQLPL